ncbi:MAG: F0F1 ATP synthase subunit delta [Arcobacteraceae bacterium]
MIDLVAKRYVKALLESSELAQVTSVCEELGKVSSAYGSEKFISIISSSEVANETKVNFILSLVDNISTTTTNLIKLLGDNKRLNVVPSIYKELKNQISVLNNSYTGVVYTNKQLDSSYVDSITEKFSKKFNINLTLEQNICDYDGIKVDIDGLGVEISFSKERLKSQMIDHILKAV